MKQYHVRKALHDTSSNQYKCILDTGLFLHTYIQVKTLLRLEIITTCLVYLKRKEKLGSDFLFTTICLMK